MTKKDVKNILISIRNIENENQINYMLGKIDLLSDEQFNTILDEVGCDEESITSYFIKKQIKKNSTTL